MTVRRHVERHSSSRYCEFFFAESTGTKAGRTRKVNSCIGEVTVTTKQAKKLNLEKRRRTSYNLEQNCILLASNESFGNVPRDLEQITGLKIGKSTVHRKAMFFEIPEIQTKKVVTA